MQNDDLNTQIPLLRFLKKHRWSIILPVLFFVCYFAVPRYFREAYACQTWLFVDTVQNASQRELSDQLQAASDRVLSDDNLAALIEKHHLFSDERQGGPVTPQLTENMRASIQIEPSTDNTASGTMVVIWIHSSKIGSKTIAAVSDDVVSQFEKDPALRVSRYSTPAYDSAGLRQSTVVVNVIRGAFFSLLLIGLWELPFLFYSQKTQKMIFDPLRSDWQRELGEAKLTGGPLAAMRVHIGYSYAFVLSMLQKSPIGELFEFVGRTAR